MKVRVLGSAAGGGLPQWNCACGACVLARHDQRQSRTQTCVAVSADEEAWFLLGASPDLRVQIERTRELHPRAGRGTPIAGVLLPNGEVDSVLGLLTLRENEPFTVYATGSVTRGFAEQNALARTLDRFDGHVTYRLLDLAHDTTLLDRSGHPTSLRCKPIPIAGHVPHHLAGLVEASPEDNVGFVIREMHRGRSLAYFPSVGRRSTALAAALDECDVAIFDGTFSSDAEVRTQRHTPRAAQLGHWPLGGDDGSLQLLSRCKAARKILIHVSDANRMLEDRSAERRAVEAAGVEVAYDGMEIAL